MTRYQSIKIKNISFILTILVVLLHSFNINKFSEYEEITLNYFVQVSISKCIATIAVPLFFIISGYLFFYKFIPTKRNWIEKYKKRFNSLVIPFLLWCIGWMSILFILQTTEFGTSLFSEMRVFELNINEIIDYTFIHPFLPFQLWYIRELILLVIISPIIYFIITKIPKESIILLVILVVMDILPLSIVAFSIVSLLAIKDIEIRFNLSKSIVNTIVVTFSGLVLLNVFLTYNRLQFTIINISIIVLGIISIWQCYDIYLFKFKDKYFKFAEYSVFIYFFHEPLQTIIKSIIFKLINSNSVSQLFVYFLAPIITITLCIILATILKRNTKKVYSIMIGGR